MTLFVDIRTGGIVRPLSRRWPPNSYVVVDGESHGCTRGHVFRLRDTRALRPLIEEVRS